MKFRLLYEGEIAPRQKAKIEDIHAIRMKLEPQLRALWQFPPLSVSAPRLLQYKDKNDPHSIGLAETRGNCPFIPIVSKKIDLQCALDITFLRQQAPGQLIGDGGDIDNRLKTLLDALSVPPLSQKDFLVKWSLSPAKRLCACCKMIPSSPSWRLKPTVCFVRHRTNIILSRLFRSP